MKAPKLGSQSLGTKIPLRVWCKEQGLVERTGQNYVAAGMPHYKLGARVFVDPEEVWAWLRDRDRKDAHARATADGRRARGRPRKLVAAE